MNVQDFVSVLDANPDASLQIMLPNGQSVPSHFHVTEVGRLEKRFVDCGGTKRKTVSCVLQAWTANDIEHRLTSGKLAKIIRMADEMFDSQDLPIELEYGQDVVSHYFVESATPSDGELRVEVVGKQTACLAMDKCLTVLPGCDASSGCCS